MLAGLNPRNNPVPKPLRGSGKGWEYHDGHSHKPGNPATSSDLGSSFVLLCKVIQSATGYLVWYQVYAMRKQGKRMRTIFTVKSQPTVG